MLHDKPYWCYKYVAANSSSPPVCQTAPLPNMLAPAAPPPSAAPALQAAQPAPPVGMLGGSCLQSCRHLPSSCCTAVQAVGALRAEGVSSEALGCCLEAAWDGRAAAPAASSHQCAVALIWGRLPAKRPPGMWVAPRLDPWHRTVSGRMPHHQSMQPLPGSYSCEGQGVRCA